MTETLRECVVDCFVNFGEVLENCVIILQKFLELSFVKVLVIFSDIQTRRVESLEIFVTVGVLFLGSFISRHDLHCFSHDCHSVFFGARILALTNSHRVDQE